MTMTFTVEDGSQVVGSNSYVTLAEANDYIAANTFANATWTVLDDPSKEALLMWATRYLDQRATWFGCLASEALHSTVPQSLRWPRSGVTDIDNVCIANDAIPRQLKQATIEMARFLIAADRSVERPQDGLKELKVDVMTLIFRDNYILPKVPSEISFIIRGIGTINSGTLGFGKIIRA